MELNRVVVVVRPVPRKVPGCTCIKAKGGRDLNLRREHARSVKRILKELDGLGIAYHIVGRYSLRGAAKADLIISVGGDGTFLAAAHRAEGTPLLGVNPDPKVSVGFFCIARAPSFKRILAQVISGKIKPVNAPLIETRIGSRKLPILALNDVLFAGRSPAETVRYCLRVKGKREDQKSSGVWIAAGPGSTAAISSAGGRRQPITSRKLQYLVREPYPVPGRKYRYTKGILGVDESVSITSSMGRGTLYIDGHRHPVPVPWKSKVTCRISSKSLKIFI